jgi:predicted Na+-dependent transporter
VLLALASTFGAGLELRGRLEAAVVARALAVNVLVVPFAGWAAAQWLELTESAQLALWLVALAPGGASSPLLARSAGAPGATTGFTFVALAVASAVLVPLGLLARGAALPGPMVLVVAAQLLPLLLGAVLARRLARWPSLPARLRTVGNALLLAVVVLLTVDRGPTLRTLGVPTLGAMAGLVALTVAGGALVARPWPAFAIFTVVRNLTLALMVSEALFPGGAVTLIVAAYGLVMYAVAGALLVVARQVTDGGAQTKP